MELGFGLPVSGAWATAGNVVGVARRAEGLGYATLWSFQRVLVPEGSGMAAPYRSVLDPVVALSVAAGVTERIRLGTAVLNMPFVAPAVLGKALASLDVLSGGRLVAGLGLGWLPEEFVAAGVPYEGRGVRAEEYLAALRALWGPDPVAFEGEHYRVPPSSVLPKPVQQPGPPVLLGGTAPKALERAGRLADGWISSSRAGFEAIAEAVRTVRGAAERAGRDPAALRMVVRAATGVDRPRTRPLTGSVDEVRGDLDTLAGYGVDETFIDLNFDDRIGNPDADADASARTAMALLEALAPAAAR